MRVGDLIVWERNLWWVRRVDREQALAEVLSHTGDLQTISSSFDRTRPELCKVHCHPATDWCVISPPVRLRRGPVIRVVYVTLDGGTTLRPFLDWISSDPTREGGPVFFHPDLRFRFGDTLLLYHKDTHNPTRVTVPLAYGTVQQRKDRNTRRLQTQEAKTRYDWVTEDEDDT